MELKIDASSMEVTEVDEILNLYGVRVFVPRRRPPIPITPEIPHASTAKR